jgi:hypothetical protein
VEQQGSTGGAERQIAQLVEDDEIGVGESRRDPAGFVLKLLLFESVDGKRWLDRAYRGVVLGR